MTENKELSPEYLWKYFYEIRSEMEYGTYMKV
jgi:hypothetical protein